MDPSLSTDMRRIALGCAAVWVVGCAAYAIVNKPDASLLYSVEAYGAEPALVDACGAKDAKKLVVATTPGGDSVDVKLCFKGDVREKDGQALVPLAPVAPRTNPLAAPLYLAHADAVAEGKFVSARLLAEQLRAIPLAAGETAVPWMAEESDDETRAYFEEVAARFNLTEAGIARVEQTRSSRWWTQGGEALLLVLGRLALGYAVSAAVLWIFRDFKRTLRRRHARRIW